MADHLNVHDVTVSETPIVGLSGQISRQVVVRYFIGGHGPFQEVYDGKEYNPEKARADIDKRVQGLRTLTAGL